MMIMVVRMLWSMTRLVPRILALMWLVASIETTFSTPETMGISHRPMTAQVAQSSSRQNIRCGVSARLTPRHMKSTLGMFARSGMDETILS